MSPTAPRRSKPSPSRRASRWSPWTARACGIRWDFSPTRSRCSSSRACRSISSRPPRPTSPCRSIPARTPWIRRRSRGSRRALGELCRVEILGPCASLSLLGHNIRGILHELGSAFELFQDHKIYLVSQAANDLNFTFVIDESQGDRLVQQLHERLIQSIGSDKVLGPTWLQLFSPKEAGAPPGLELVGGARAAAPAARHRARASRRRSSTTWRASMRPSLRCAACDRWRAGRIR